MIIQKTREWAKHFVQFCIMSIQEPGLQVSTRVRHQLWKQGLAKTEWKHWLDQRLPREGGRNSDLLAGRLRDDLIDEDYLLSLAGVFDLEPEDLRFGQSLGSKVQVLVENLNYLIKGEGFGGKGRLARELGVNPTTISRWLGGESIPPATTQARLAIHFRLPKGTDLTRDPVFLGLTPVSYQEKRAWLDEHLATLPPDILGDLFPAFQRLLERP